MSSEGAGRHRASGGGRRGPGGGGGGRPPPERWGGGSAARNLPYDAPGGPLDGSDASSGREVDVNGHIDPDHRVVWRVMLIDALPSP
jgi:hypothetical protein